MLTGPRPEHHRHQGISWAQGYFQCVRQRDMRRLHCWDLVCYRLGSLRAEIASDFRDAGLGGALPDLLQHVRRSLSKAAHFCT